MQHEFVTLMPQELQEDVLYISIKYKTATHLCACGCGNKVMTSITPTGWALTYNGNHISLYPSIGSWNLPCKSHYWIKKGQVIWAESWSEKQIHAVQSQDKLERAKYFERSKEPTKSLYNHPKLKSNIWIKILSIFK